MEEDHFIIIIIITIICIFPILRFSYKGKTT